MIRLRKTWLSITQSTSYLLAYSKIFKYNKVFKVASLWLSANNNIIVIVLMPCSVTFMTGLRCFDTVDWASGRVSARRNWVMRCWCGYISVARCRLFVFMVQLTHCHPKIPSSLALFKHRLVLPFWYRPTQVVLEKRPGLANLLW